jgi:hypothetical protein
MFGEGNQDLALVASFVGEVKDASSLDVMKGVQFPAEVLEERSGKCRKCVAVQSEQLGGIKESSPADLQAGGVGFRTQIPPRAGLP